MAFTQPRARSPTQKHVHQPLGAFTRSRARSPTQEHVHLRACGTGCPVSAPTGGRGRGEGGWSGRSWAGRPTTRRPTAAASHRRRRRRPGGVVPQGPAARQHRSRGPPGRRRRRANPHPGRRPPSTQPPTTSTTRHARHHADDPPTQPPREAQPGHVTHGHRPDNEHRPFSRRTSTVLTSNKYRSHGRAGSGPYQPPPCPYQERPDSQAPGVLGALVGGLPVPGPPSPAPGSQRAVRLLGLGEP